MDAMDKPERFERLPKEEVFARDDIHIFTYVPNMAGIRAIEFGALFVFVIAVLVYPMTHFEPRAWMIMPMILVPIGIALLVFAQYWRRFVRDAFLTYDDKNFYVGSDPRRTVVVPWHIMTLKSTGLSDPKAGANLRMTCGQESVRVRLFTNVVCIPQFDALLYTILVHVKENESSAKTSASADHAKA